MKKMYLSPELKIKSFEAESVLTASGEQYIESLKKWNEDNEGSRLAQVSYEDFMLVY